AGGSGPGLVIGANALTDSTRRRGVIGRQQDSYALAGGECSRGVGVERVAGASANEEDQRRPWRVVRGQHAWRGWALPRQCSQQANAERVLDGFSRNTAGAEQARLGPGQVDDGRFDADLG